MTLSTNKRTMIDQLNSRLRIQNFKAIHFEKCKLGAKNHYILLPLFSLVK